MQITIFEIPNEESVPFKRPGTTMETVSLKYTEYLSKGSKFEFELATTAKIFPYLKKGHLVYAIWNLDGIAYSCTGIIKAINSFMDKQRKTTTVTCYDLKSIFNSRITLPTQYVTITGTAGYDAVTGTTEACIKHFWNNNIVNPPQEYRRIPNLTVLPNLNRGITDDKYKSRHENLGEVTTKLCEAAQMGYTVEADFKEGLFFCDCFTGTRRTIDGNETPIIFSLNNRSLLSYDSLTSDENLKTLFYSTKSGAEFEDEALTMLYYRDEMPKGWERLEHHLSISVNTPIAGEEYDELRRLSEIEMKQYEEINTIKGKPSRKFKLNKDFFLGDFITIFIDDLGLRLDTQITGVSHSVDRNNSTQDLIFGNSVPTVMEIINRKISNR